MATIKEAASLARVNALHAHYGDSRLNFRGIRGTLIADGKVRTSSGETFDSIGKWATSLKMGAVGDMWKTVAIRVNETNMPLGQAERLIPRPALQSVVPVDEQTV